MKYKPADHIQDLQYFGEFGGVNPSISDSSTYTFLSAKTMFDTFEGNAEGCYLYSRHSSPSNLYLGEALAVKINILGSLDHSQLDGTPNTVVFLFSGGPGKPIMCKMCERGVKI